MHLLLHRHAMTHTREMMLMSAHQCIGNKKRSPVNPMMWHSKKIQKVAVNTLSAEAMALAGAVDMLSWVRLFWAWIVTIDVTGDKPMRPCCLCHQRSQHEHQSCQNDKPMPEVSTAMLNLSNHFLISAIVTHHLHAQNFEHNFKQS